MFASMVALITGEYFFAAFLTAILLFTVTLYAIVTKDDNYNTFNSRAAVGILCAIITDVAWSYISYNRASYGGFPRPLLNMMSQFGCVLTVFFFGVVFNNFLNRKEFVKYKVLCTAVSFVSQVFLALNYGLFTFGHEVIKVSEAYPFLLDSLAFFLHGLSVLILGSLTFIPMNRTWRKRVAVWTFAAIYVAITGLGMYYRGVLALNYPFN